MEMTGNPASPAALLPERISNRKRQRSPYRPHGIGLMNMRVETNGYEWQAEGIFEKFQIENAMTPAIRLV